MRIKVSKLSHPIILLIIMKLIASCTPETCLLETTAFLNAGFYKTGTDKPIAPDSITVFGIGKGSSRLYSKSLNLSSIKLPLDASRNTCGFVLKINNLTDTLRVIYTGYPHLISKECGITFFFSLNSIRVTGTVVDTIATINKNITTFNEENIRIFY